MQGSRYRSAVFIMLIALVATVLAAVPSAAAGDCPSGHTQYKIDRQPSNGTYGDGTLSVTISNADSDSFNWSSNIEVSSVMVKGGTTLKTNPGGTSGSASSAQNPNSGKPYGISHVSFCYTTEGGDTGASDGGNGSDDCPGKGNGHGNGGSKQCEEEGSTPSGSDDCVGKGNGNGNGGSKDCEEEGSTPRSDDCPGKGNGNGNGHGNMNDDCDEDDDQDDDQDDDETLGDVDGRPSLPDDRGPGGNDGSGNGRGDAGSNDTPDADVRGIRVAAEADRGVGAAGGAQGAPQVEGQQAPGQTLPFTGFAVLPFLLAGVGLVSAGLLLRHRRKQ